MDKFQFLAGLGVPAETIAVMKAHHQSLGAPAPRGSGIVPAGNAAPISSQPTGRLNGPMLPDCKPIKGKVPGPAHHLLCEVHGHVLDVKQKTIIALSLEQYKANAHRGPSPDAKPKTDAAGAPEVAATAGPTPTAGGASAAAKAQEEAKKVIKLFQIQQEDLASTIAEFEKSNEGGIIEWGVAGVSHLFGDAKNPGDALSKMQFQLLAEMGAGMQMLTAAGGPDIAEARKHLAVMDAITEKARKLVLAYTTDTSGAERAIKVLQVADKAGDVATAGLEVLAPGVGQALSLGKKGGVALMHVHLGDEVNWAEFGVEVACDLFFDKVGGGEMAKRITGPVTSKLVEKFAGKVSKEFIEKSVEEVVKHEMTTVVKQTAGGIYDVAKGKPITYEEFLSKMVDAMTDPKELLVSMISSKVQVSVRK